MPPRRLLVTGATGKVGRYFIDRLFRDPRQDSTIIRALCHNRVLDASARLEVVRGSISDRGLVKEALRDVTHVLHLATCKETPAEIMDVAIKGLYWILEECRESPAFRQFLLVGGDAGMGHFFYPHPIPVTETQKHSAYPGCYAFSKAIEEDMLEQYYVQYGLNGCCLRAPWIMEKDDFKYQLSFGDDVFGGPRWRDLVGVEKAEQHRAAHAVPVMLDPDGQPILRNFVHVDDLADAILLALDHPKAKQQTFNICMNEPVDYRKLAEYLKRTRGYPSVDIKTPHFSTWLDNCKAKFLLGWRPKYDLARMTDEAFDYQRAATDPRTVWYPG